MPYLAFWQLRKCPSTPLPPQKKQIHSKFLWHLRKWFPVHWMQPFGTPVGNFLHAISSSYFFAHQPHPTNTPVPTVENILLGSNSRDCSTLHCHAIIYTSTTGFQPWEATTVWWFFFTLAYFWILLTLGYSPQPKDILLRSPYLLVIFNSLFIVNQPLYEKFPFHITLRYLPTDWIRLIHSKGKYMSLLSRWQSRRTWAHLLSWKHQITSICRTTISKKDWHLPKKIFHIQRQRRQ